MIINNNAKLMEVFCAYAIKEVFFCNENFAVGDLPQEHIPDIYNIDKTLGIERKLQATNRCNVPRIKNIPLSKGGFFFIYLF